MKTTIFFSILLFPSILLGQVINHFSNQDSKWHVAKSYPAANQQNPSFVATTTTVYGLQGDTIIDSEQWFKLYSTNDSTFQNDLLYRGLLRADNSEVLYLDTLNQLETLYDFSLSVGDSALFDLYSTNPEWLHVSGVDSVFMNGDFYKRIQFDEPSISAFSWLNEGWIEGIGSKHGPLFPLSPVMFSEEIPDSMLLTCSFSAGQQIWNHPSYSSCYTNIVLGVDQLNSFDFTVYPNPFSDRIHIETHDLRQYELTILNSLGQTIRQTQVNKVNTTIDLANLKRGVYFLKVDSRGEAKTIKITKTR